VTQQYGGADQVCDWASDVTFGTKAGAF